MYDFTGIKCPVCGVPFRKEDDVVVCPECGAPYHRECYHQTGECIFEDLHKEGKEWAPPAPPVAPDPTVEIKDHECPICGTLNGKSALFCSRCGTSLLGEPQKYNNTPPPGAFSGSQPPPFSTQKTPYSSPVMPPFGFDPMGGVSPAESLDADVTFGDVSKLVKQNTAYYMPVFQYIKRTGKNKFNFSAFLFSGAWMLYRKQYKYGAIITGLMFALYLALQAAYWLAAYPTMAALATQAGLDSTQMYLFTEEQYWAISTLAAQSPSAAFQLMLPFLVLLLILACMIFVGIRGNKMYLNHCVSTMRGIKTEGTEDDPAMALQVKGGVNSMASLGVVIAYFVVRTAIILIL